MEALQDGTKQGYGTVQLVNGETHYGRVDTGTGWVTVTADDGDVQTLPSGAVIRVLWDGASERPTDDPVLGGPPLDEDGYVLPELLAVLLVAAVVIGVGVHFLGALPVILAVLIVLVLAFAGRDRLRF